MKTQELVKILERNEGDYVSFIRYETKIGSSLPLKTENLELSLVSRERQDSDFIVIFTADHDYFRLTGSYNSWEGIEFYDFFDIQKVFPKEKTVTIFETSNEQ